MKKEFKNLDPEKLKKLDQMIELFTEEAEEDVLWYDGKSIDEVAFCDYMLSKHPMKCIHNVLYDLDGKIDEGRLGNEIYNEIREYITTNIAQRINKLIEALKHAAFSPEMQPDEDHIHFNNGTYCVADHSFSPEKTFCMNRMPVDYDPKAKEPEKWLSFLKELLYEEDIPALQEFMGYTLIPTNRAQIMMVIIGNGGEGKSRIALVLRALHGDNMNIYSISKLAKDKFAKADQSGKLLMVDDDLETDALPDTGVLKTIVTLEGKYDLEQKKKQSFQGWLYVRLLALGNGTLSALYDKSDGFYRRQLVIQVKPKPPDRIDDRKLIDKMLQEKEGILQWCLEGLQRLIEQNYEFTLSDRMKKNLEEMRKNDNNIIDFYESEGYIHFNKNSYVQSRKLYQAYKKWCEDNLEKPFSEKTFAMQLRRDHEKLNLRYDKNLDIGGGKKARGYHGVAVMIRTDEPWIYGN